MKRKSRATPLEERLTYRCLLIANRTSRFLAPMLESHGLSVTTWRVVAVIGRYAPLSAKEAATRSSTDAFQISRAIDYLAKKKLIRRELDKNDKRRVQLVLTPSGHRLHDEISSAISSIEDELLAGLAQKSRELLLSALDDIEKRGQAMASSSLTWKDFARDR